VRPTLTPPSQRVLARKVAAHYGMRCEPTADEGVCLSKGQACRGPPSRLQDVPVTEPANAAQSAPVAPSGALARVQRVMRRSASGGGGGGLGGGGSGEPSSQPSTPKSMEEREAEYERVRERILGSSAALAEAAAQPGVCREGSGGEQSAPAEGAPSDCAAAAALRSEPSGVAAPAQPPPPAAPAAAALHTMTAQQQAQARRATLRDRAADAADPDFQRGGAARGMHAGHAVYAQPQPYAGYEGYEAAPYGYAQSMAHHFPALGSQQQPFMPPLSAPPQWNGGGMYWQPESQAHAQGW